MTWEEGVEEEYGEEMAASESEEEVVVGQMPTVMVPKHIKKRSLKNKALSVTLDEKALRDFVTGFHKRKKKRRKEAQKILQEKERKKRIRERKRRKEEKEVAMYGRVLSSDNADGAGLENEGIHNDGEEMETTDDLSASLSETKTYEDDGTRITVTTCKITGEDGDLGPKIVGPVSASYTTKNPSSAGKKNSSLGVKKKPQKRTFKNKIKKKKGDKKRGAAKGKRKNKGRK
ncbi:ribosomal RNA-processing protein 17-like [Phragmites australis]|uniref:ribosomal RNA-processing protein 17-like n=1 Tax=Phragmites australis TaxID=29695 RepID=UPI002D772046|nr:ribosomal RNA-processing protein 17-like [Phragmites australis]